MPSYSEPIERARVGVKRVEDLTQAARDAETKSPLHIERVKTALYAAAACDVFQFKKHYLPRGYDLIEDSRTASGWRIRHNQKVVTDTHFALDIATGWLDELADWMTEKLSPGSSMRPALPAPVTSADTNSETS